jgi:diguanylate cyclase (GGDEF)-like protein
MFDIDRFKQINDTYGHAAGDSVLKTIANLAKEAVREVDFVARIGGEEFAILLPEVSVEQALVTAERLRERVAERSLDYQGQKLAFTASFGVTQLDEADQDFETVLHRADQAMYRSKKLGRNQVSLSCQL